MIDGPEKIVAAVRARLVAELAGFVDQINALHTDGIDVTKPDDQFIYEFIPPRSMMVNFPCIGIQEGTFYLEDDTGWGGTGVVQISVVSYEQDPDPDALAKKLRRLDAAVTACVLDGRRMPPDGWGVKFIRSDPGPTLGRQESPREFMSLRATTIEVRFEQDTP